MTYNIFTNNKCEQQCGNDNFKIIIIIFTLECTLMPEGLNRKEKTAEMARGPECYQHSKGEETGGSMLRQRGQLPPNLGLAPPQI